MSFAGGGGPPIAEALIAIRADTARFEKDLRSKVNAAIGSAGDEAAKTLTSKLDAAGSKMSALGGKLSKAVSLPLVAGLGAATKAASDLNEAVNVTGLVFGDARGEIDQFAKEAAKGLGQSERAAREATAQIGGLLKNLGLSQDETVRWSKDLTVLASDLGSAFNKEPAEAVQALGSALRGETEPIRQFNVMLDDATVRQRAVQMGLAATTAEVDKAGKAQATLALIMEQTAVVQGDFANTADGVANKARIMKAQLEDSAAALGTSLIPIAQKGIGIVSKLAEGFAGLPGPLQEASVVAAVAFAVSGPLIAGAGKAVQAVTGLAKAVQFLAVSNNAAAVSASGLGLGLVGIGAGYLAARTYVNAFNDANDKLIAGQEEATNAIALGAAATKEQVIDAYVDAAEFTGGAAEANRNYAKSFDPVQEAAKKTLRSISEESNVSRQRIVQLANSLGINLGAMSDEAKEKLDGALRSIAGGVTPTERLAEAQETLGNEFATGREQVEAYEEALDAALGTFLDAQTSALRYADSVDDLGKSIQENGRVVGLNGEKQRALAGALNDVVRAAERDIEAMAQSGIITNDATTKKQALLDRLNDLKRRFPELAGPINDYVLHLNMIPAEKSTNVKVNIDKASASILTILSNAIPDLQVFVGGAGSQRRQHGGPVYPGNLYTILEGGKDEFFIPNVAGRIEPAERVLQTVGATEQRRVFIGGDVHIDARGSTDPVATSDDVVDNLRHLATRLGFA